MASKHASPSAAALLTQVYHRRPSFPGRIEPSSIRHRRDHSDHQPLRRPGGLVSLRPARPRLHPRRHRQLQPPGRRDPPWPHGNLNDALRRRQRQRPARYHHPTRRTPQSEHRQRDDVFHREFSSGPKLKPARYLPNMESQSVGRFFCMGLLCADGMEGMRPSCC